jgi:hypothetical protein
MKKLIQSALACIALVISSCNQNSPAPAPAPAAPTPAPTPTTSFSHADSLISGNWILDLTELYSLPSNTLTIAIPHNDPANCHLNLLLLEQPSAGITPSPKHCVDGLGCSPVNSYWRFNAAGDFDVSSAIYNIITQTPTSLVLERSTTGGKLKFYFHK